MTKHYLITFKPLGAFYFGGEQTFGSGAQTNYFVKSNYFPQQTGILGLLRYELLLQNGLLNAGKSKKLSSGAANLIGSKSFHFNGSNSTIDFGAIERISPLFILDKNKKKLLPAPFDIRSNSKYLTYEFREKAESKTNLKIDAKAVTLTYNEGKKHYSEKDGIYHQFINKDKKLFQYLPRKDDFDNPIYEKRSDEDKLYQDYIFLENQKIGIHKAGTDESFYKQTKLQFNEGYAFAIYATLDVPAGKTFKSNTVFMGGDKSAFEMTVEEVQEFKTPIYNEAVINTNNEDIKKLILTSPAFVDKGIYDHCVFAISEQQSFRFLQTSVEETECYYNLDNNKYKMNAKKSAPYKSEQFNLLKAGSVFYYKDEKLQGLEDELNKHPQFKQIGYNYYQTK